MNTGTGRLNAAGQIIDSTNSPFVKHQDATERASRLLNPDQAMTLDTRDANKQFSEALDSTIDQIDNFRRVQPRSRSQKVMEAIRGVFRFIRDKEELPGG